MENGTPSEEGVKSLRARVEAQLRTKGAPGGTLPAEIDSLRLLHELQVHQVELELQNEELTRTRAELEMSLRRYTGLYYCAPAAYVSLDRNGGIAKGNKAAEDLLGLKLPGALRHRFSNFVSGADRAVFGPFLEKAFDATAVTSIDLELCAAGGRSLFVHLDACRQVPDDECLVMIADLSALRESDRERERLQMQLWQAQKMETIGRLAGGIAHDLNNMHCASLLQLNMLENSGCLDEEARRMIGELKGLSLRSSTLTQQLLLFSRKSPMKLAPADLNQVVQSVLQMLGRIIGDSYDLEFLPVGRTLPTCVDASKIQQVLMNLVINARDAMPSGGRLSIITRALDFSREAVEGVPETRRLGSFASLEVHDEGCGIKPELLSCIFDPFFTTKEVGRGTGLGLSIVDGIVHQHGGWVEVRSQVGSGSVFTVYLPRLDDAVLVPESQRLDEDPVPGRGELLLLVEDEHLLRMAAARSLSLNGYRVLEASSAVEALAIWELQAPQVQLLLTDMSMPGGMSGLELARKMLFTKPDLPVVLMSGYSQELLGLNLDQDAGISLLEKPFTVEQLTKCIRQTLCPD